jgi:DNA-damage-inducible protein D
MTRKLTSKTGVQALLNKSTIRRFERDGETWYSAVDVLAQLTDSPAPADAWTDLRQEQPAIDKRVESAVEADAGPATDEPAVAESVDVLDLQGVLRLIQAVDSPRAERLKAWIADTVAARLAEGENPETAALRARREYEAKGYGRRWAEKRVRGRSARQEATSEWYKRGATDSDQFRALTNAVVEEAFGMDTPTFRRHKGLFRTSEALRDHMSDLELGLTALGETLAVALHRDRDSRGFEALEQDARDAGRIVARTRADIETRLGHTVISGEISGYEAGRV